MTAEADKILNVDSLARGDSHMVARLLDTWNAARTERATWPLPWDEDYDVREVSMDCHHAATLILGVLAGTWVRHLLREVGVKDNDLPPPTSAQQRRLVRLLNAELDSDDNGRQLLAYWAKGLLSGQTERVQHDFERLAGDMDLDILAAIVNHVRRTSAQFNGRDFTFTEKPTCHLCGRQLTPPQMYPYGPETPDSTDCGGDCLACVRKVENESRAAGE